MSRCPSGLYHFEPVTDTELLKIISCMHKTTCSSDPFHIIIIIALWNYFSKTFINNFNSNISIFYSIITSL